MYLFPRFHLLQEKFQVSFLPNMFKVQLQHFLRLLLLKDIFTLEFLRKAQTLFAKSVKLVTEFSTEVCVAAEVSIPVYPV